MVDLCRVVCWCAHHYCFYGELPGNQKRYDESCEKFTVGVVAFLSKVKQLREITFSGDYLAEGTSRTQALYNKWITFGAWPWLTQVGQDLEGFYTLSMARKYS